MLEALKPDFPDITISKIRFLEAEGLVKPGRTQAGYRSFTAADVERLRYILAAQRDRFWPLKVIREALDAMDRGLQPAEPGGARPSVPTPQSDPDVPTAQELSTPPAPLRLTRAEVAQAAGLDDATMDALTGFGLLRPAPDGHYPASALPIAQAAAALASYGIEPRHLRPFRTAADREIGLVQQVVSPRRGRERDEESTAALLRHCLSLHAALVKASFTA